MSADEGETRRELPGPRPAPSPAPDTAFDLDRERFQLGEELGRGGMGRVVAATDRALAREVAIKQALTDDEVQLARFEREVRITAQLEHPSIVPIHDAGRDKTGRPYYVMRRLDGDQLSDRVAAATSVRGRLALVPNVLAAVDAAAFAHARKIIHRDIKPWNILVGSYGETLLIDWGLARELDEAELPPSGRSDPLDRALTRVGGVFGTPGYMAPEQARGESADERADVYALGATLLHVLTGESTLAGTSATAWIERAVSGETTAATFPPEVPRELIAIVAKAMAERREDRYRDAGELASDLRAFLAGQLVAAHHYTRRERIARFVRRHRVAIAIAAAALVAVATVATISIRNVIEERDLARTAREEAERERATALKERALANDRTELLLLDRASALTTTDPTRSLALLRQLPATSPHLDRARDIASVAAFRGITKGVATDLDNINVLAFTPDGTSLVAAGEKGEVWVIDVATGNHRVYAAKARTSTGLLFDRDHLLLSAYRGGLVRLDLRTGVVETIDDKADLLWIVKIDDDRIRYFDSIQRTVTERSLTTGVVRILATDVRGALSMGERLVVADGKTLQLHDGARVIDLHAPPAYGDGTIAAADLVNGRFAIASLDGVTEWDLAGNETQRWKLRVTSGLLYGDGGVLYATSNEGKLVSLGKTGVNELGRQSGAIWWRARIRGGAAFLDSDGHVTLVAGVHPLSYPLDHPRSRTIAASPDGRYLAVGTAEGTVRWLDVALLQPEIYKVKSGTQACSADDKEIIAIGRGTIRAIARGTGETRELGSYPEGLPYGCSGRIDNTLIFASVLGTLFVDLDYKRHYLVRNYGFADGGLGRYVFPRERDLVELDVSARTEKVRWRAPTAIELFASRGQWAAITTKPDVLYRIDRTTDAVASLRVPGIEMIAVAHDGAVAYAHERQLTLWDGNTTKLVVALPPGEVALLSEMDNGWGMRMQDGSLWFAGPAGLIQRIPPNRVGFSGMGPRDLAWRLSANQRLYRLHLRSGEQLVLDIPLTMLTRASDRLSVGTGEDFLAVFEDKVPFEAVKLFDWIDRTTNAYLDATSALRWTGQRTR